MEVAMRRGIRGLAMTIALALAAPAAADEAATLPRVIDPIVTSYMMTSGAPGAGVVVVRDGRVIFLKAYGEADREAHRAATPQTVWPIASITKLVTALAVMQQVEQGRLRLSQDIAAQVTSLRVPATQPGPIRLADTLRHTTGLDEIPGRQVEAPDRIPPLAAFLQPRLVRWRPAGGYTSYSTYGVALAAVALEDASGEPYEAYVRRHIFAPLGLTSARIMVTPQSTRDVAAPYELDGDGPKRIAYEWYATPPTSSAAMSLDDVARWLLDLTSPRPRLLRRATLDEMMRQQSSLDPTVPGWGYGFQLDRVERLRIAEHGGDIGGFSSLLSVAPDRRIAIFIVSHGEGANMRFRLRDAIIHALAPGPKPRLPPEQPVDLAPFAGRYRASFQCHTCAEPTGPEFEIGVSGGGLSAFGGAWRPVGHDRFANPADGRRLAFVRDAAGVVVAVTAGAWRVGERIGAPTPADVR
jgi:CubicO group peptidase (beta-lactamase class C family)